MFNLIPKRRALLRGIAPLVASLGAGLALLLAVGCDGAPAPTPTPTHMPSPSATSVPPTLLPTVIPTVTPVPPRFQALRAPITYAALGASDTVGVGADDPDTGNWPAQLAARLPTGTRLQRFAHSGNTLGEALEVQVPRLIASNPDLITVWLVVNDGLHGVAPATYRQQLHTLLTRLSSETHAPIVLLNMPDMSLILPPNATPTTRATMQSITGGWNAVIAAEAALFPDRVLLVDLYGPSQASGGRPDWISSDQFHPNTAGYGALAGVVYDAMGRDGLVPREETP